MAPEPSAPTLAETLRTRPTVCIGDDVDRELRETLREWAHTHGLEILDRGATLAITTLPALPHTPQTTGLISPQLLQAFDRVHLLNIGRGSAIRTDTLVGALDTGRVRHATLDVAEPEPLDPASPLWRRADVTITPHVSGLTFPSDVVTSLDAALTQVRDGIRPTSAVERDRGY